MSPTARTLVRGFSLTELLVGVVIGSILILGVVQMMRTGIQSSKKSLQGGRMDESLDRFVNMMTNDLSKAGSDPFGDTLQAYIFQATCAGKLIFKYGIDPEPADPTCATPLGNIGILSYLAYDANADGAVDPEEGLDLVSPVPTLRSTPEDYVIYQFISNTVVRKNVGNPDSTADDSQATALENVVSFATRYYGYDDDGIYGQITDNARYDDIREVEVLVTVHGGVAERDYNNPTLLSSDPFYHHRTESRTFRVPLIVRKE